MLISFSSSQNEELNLFERAKQEVLNQGVFTEEVLSSAVQELHMKELNNLESRLRQLEERFTPSEYQIDLQRKSEKIQKEIRNEIHQYNAKRMPEVSPTSSRHAETFKSTFSVIEDEEHKANNI